jgi:hypothetical protein
LENEGWQDIMKEEITHVSLYRTVYCNNTLNIFHAVFHARMMKYLKEEILVLRYAGAYLNSKPF